MFSYVFPLRNPHVASFILRQCVHSPASLSHVAQAAREQLSVRRSRKSGSRVDGNEEKGGVPSGYVKIAIENGIYSEFSH